jgi:integrase
MPQRTGKGPRLWLQPERQEKGGRIRQASWIIRDDGSIFIRTGCIREDRKGAERALQEYIASKYKVSRDHSRSPAEILVVDVLNIYIADQQHLGKQSPIKLKQVGHRALRLAEYWNGKTLADVNGNSCRAYVAWRVGQQWKSSRPESTGNAPRLVGIAAPRRELQDLKAAINHHRREGLCSEIVSVVLPEKPKSREQWLTRDEVARSLKAAWRMQQVINGVPIRGTGKHIAHAILVGLYTGTRHAAICAASFQPAIGRGYIDLENGLFYRHAQGARETKKRQTPVRLHPRLLAHLRRWHRLGLCKHAVIEWNGKPIKYFRDGFARAVRIAGFDPHKITPHILRHTAATWMMQNGADLWDAAGFLGMSIQTLQQVYGHHHPKLHDTALLAIGKRPEQGANKPFGGTGVAQDRREQTVINVVKRHKKR